MIERTTLQAIEEAEVALEKVRGDDEAYHSVFDDLLEARLKEFDPVFLDSMKELYEKSDMARWCA